MSYLHAIACRRRRPWCAVVLTVITSMAAAGTYNYDALGRLSTQTAATGETAEFVNDDAGNLLEVKRYAAGTLAVTGFVPRRPFEIFGSDLR